MFRMRGRAAIDGLDPTGLSALLASRAQKPFATIADFRSRLPQGASIASEATFDVRSQYFIVTVIARQGGTRAQARALVDRSKGAWPAIVWQTLE